MTITLPPALDRIEQGTQVLGALRIDGEETFYEWGEATEVTPAYVTIDNGNAFYITDAAWYELGDGFDPAAGLTEVEFEDIALGDHIIAVRIVRNQATVIDTKKVVERDDEWYSSDPEKTATWKLPAYKYYRV